MYYYFTNSKTNKRYNQLESIYLLEGQLVELSTSSFKSKIGIGDITDNTKGIVYRIEKINNTDYMIKGHLLKYPTHIKYIIFHNGFVDKTDYDYQIIEEGYIMENE